VLITAVIVLPAAGIAGAVAPRAATAARTAPRAAAGATVAPVVACGQLGRDDFSNVPDAPAAVLSATQASGICQVAGYITPQEQFLLTPPGQRIHRPVPAAGLRWAVRPRPPRLSGVWGYRELHGFRA
jgi:hypothetical protein